MKRKSKRKSHQAKPGKKMASFPMGLVA